MVKVRTKWLAALSDGTTAIEGDEPFTIAKDEPSPMQKLLAHLEANKGPTPELPEGLRITGMRVQVFKPGEATHTYNAPTQQQTPEGNHEKWVSLRPKFPIHYDCFRWRTSALYSGKNQHQIELRSFFADGSIISLFIDQDEGNECWVVRHKSKDQDEKSRIEAPK